ncbi:MAG: hypothetical protein WKG00_08795, partial [Polyangiaceae bacterium]
MIEPEVHPGDDRRRPLAVGGLDVQHRGQVAGPELADLVDHDLRLLERVAAGVEVLIRAAHQADVADALPVGVELHVHRAAVVDARDGERLAGASHCRPVDGVLVDGDIDAVER